MKTLIPLTALAALAAAGLSYAQESTAAYSKPSGYITLGNPDGNEATPDVPANSEVTVSISLDRPTEYAGVISAINGSQISFTTPGFTDSGFADPAVPYQILVTSGDEIGFRALISANNTTSVSVSAVIAGDLAGLSVGDKVAISKTWTLKTFFPTTFPVGTRVLAFSGTTAGENLASGLQYVWNGSDWLQLVGGSGIQSNAILYHGESFIVQTGSTAITNFVVTGVVPTTPGRVNISKLAAGSQDNRIAITSPVDQPIIESGLGFTPGDRLLAFNSTSTGKNKAANVTLVWNGASWIGLSGVSGNQDQYLLKAGVGYVYKRVSTAPTGDVDWVQTQSYLDDL